MTDSGECENTLFAWTTSIGRLGEELEAELSTRTRWGRLSPTPSRTSVSWAATSTSGEISMP